MKKIVFLICLSFICFSSSIFSQDILGNKHTSIYVVPSTLIDYTPHFRFGGEYMFDSGLALSLDYGFAGFMTKSSDFRSIESDDDYKFNVIRPEIKQYVFKSENTALYGAFEYFYIHSEHKIYNSYYNDEINGSRIDFKQAKYRKLKRGGHLKLGFKSLTADIVSFDFYLGLGLAERNIRYKDVITDSSIDVENKKNDWHGIKHDAGYSKLIHFTAGFKVGIML